MHIVRSLKTKIICPNWREEADFYQVHFGMEVAEQWDEPTDQGIILAFPGRREALLEVYNGPKCGLDGLSMQFRVDDVTLFAASLDSMVKAVGPVDRPWGARYLYLTDPAGVSVIVYSDGW